MASDEHYMWHAIELAKKGVGKTSPNPAVGCIIVNGGKIVGAGYHEKAGLPHAEAVALEEAGPLANGATAYVTLEPCCCHGRTPPCTQALINAGIVRVVAAMQDPNPQVAGNGFKELEKAGVDVEVGLLEQEAQKLNDAYSTYIRQNRPYVTLKAAITLDGKIATRAGESKWISGEEARHYVHELRDKTDAILVGVNTVLKDDPELTARPIGRKGNPVKRIILDSKLRIPEYAKVLETGAEGDDGLEDEEEGLETIIATTQGAPLPNVRALEKPNVRILFVDEKGGRVDMQKLMVELARDGVTSVLIEGGAEIFASALEAGIVDKVLLFVAPKIMGGDSKSVIGGRGIEKLSQAINLRRLEAKKIGDDLMIEGYF